MADLFTSALSGMNAAQVGVATTQHNIANANTPGYTRQQVQLSSRAGQQTGFGFVGQGVDVTSVIRIYDQFLNTQLLQEQNQAGYLTTYHTAIKQIDNLISDPTAGASPAIQSFFNALNGVASAPESVPARQTLLSDAQFAVNRFQAIDQRLTDIANALTGQVSDSVNLINSYAQQISVLNGNIKRAGSLGQGQQPNDLIDQRNQLISQLNQEIKTTVVQQPDGTANVFVGSGQALVIDEQSMRLQVVQSANDPSKVDIAYLSNNKAFTLQQSSVQGGKIGAYLAFRDQTLEPARNALGRVAVGMAISINQQNQLGQDLNGVLGGRLFNVAVPRVDKNASNNAASGVPSVTITDVAGLTTSDYQLRFNGGTGYSLVRLSDNVTMSYATLPQTVDGMTITAPTPVAIGDSFLIRPTANGARDISLATNDPAKIAAAAPIRGAAALANTGNATIGSGAVNLSPVTISFSDPALPPQTYTVTDTSGAAAPVTGNYVAGNPISYNGWTTQISGAPAANDKFTVARNLNSTSTVALLATPASTNTGTGIISPASVSLNTPFSVTFNAVAQTYTVTGAVPDVSATPVAYTPGSPINLSYNGWTAQITGTPATGDVFTFEPNTGATGDNRNALLMAGLQAQNLMANGTVSLQGAYSQLIGSVGAKTSEMAVTSLAQTNMVAQTVAAQQAVSGVNLDEEAANLIRYQNAYQAAAKAMQIASTMFDAILALGR